MLTRLGYRDRQQRSRQETEPLILLPRGRPRMAYDAREGSCPAPRESEREGA